MFGRPKKLKARWEKFYSKEEMNFEVPDISIYDQVKESAKNYPNYKAYTYFGTKDTFRGMHKEIIRCAKAFNALGVKKGDIVTICMPNTPEAIIAFYALNRLGAISNMIHPLSSEEEIKHYLQEAKSKYMLMVDLCYEKVKNIIDETNLKRVVVVSPKDSMPMLLKVGYTLTKQRKYKRPRFNKTYISWLKFMAYSLKRETLPDVEFGKDDAAVILHSGGTTGKPKGILLSNGSFVALTMQVKYKFKRLKPGDSCLAVMPIFHGFGLAVGIHTFYALGMSTSILPQFDAKTFDKLLDKYKPNLMLGVPTLYEALSNNKNVKNLDLSNLKYVICGGDSLNYNLEQKVKKYLEDHGCYAGIQQGYGMTEALAAVASGSKEVNKIGSIGIPLPGNYIQIIDPATKKEVKPGESGEICICGPTVMMGYLDNEKETNELLQLHKDGHIWLHTGDLGHMDEEGFIFYEQRLKRMIVSSGYNVYPQYVEEAIEKHPAVLQCTVVGVPHPYKMEVPKAFIVLKDGYHATLMTKLSIKDHCKKQVAHYAVPNKFVYRKSLPKTLIGKIDFKALQQDEDGDDYDEEVDE